ncbi:hypothetical protein [Streptomyces mirabilis]
MIDDDEYIRLVPHTTSPLARGFWFVARAVVAWWERAVDAIRR